ncbi:AfsR/SARP family transcriptional regulator [Lentzea sp. NEAU-D7]|uniref:AfsR/SARP family transcriptional regulator n=1 Tax=Lentzea sp. NEAU-D7 TaxID=2994667 RepID=UPI00224B5866|nr:bacterial transcriptional activator domain-containing protein [Lentzea sp. NEAU-D7]MCX2946940.1 bacterial transcriptional activator domain-containing protein [Lentzea sp. NEAU-D7]
MTPGPDAPCVSGLWSAVVAVAAAAVQAGARTAGVARLAAVQTDPLRESAHRTLVQLHLADGNPAQALRQYQTYRALLRAELGLEPSPHIHDLMRPLLKSARC